VERTCVAIIPARGGSKGIPRKNVMPLCGKPMLAWTVEAAQAAKQVDRVVVSTDDPEIGALAQRLGADVVWRPAEISGDGASSETALQHVLEEIGSRDDYQPDLIVFLQCTSPLTAAEDIDGTINALIEEDADTALAVTEFHYFLWRRDGEQAAVGINHDKQVRQLRQEQDPQYLEAGAVYVMRREGFQRVKHRFFGKTALYVMPAERCHEIDDPVDACVAEVLIRDRGRGLAMAKLPPRVSAVAFDFDGVWTDNRVMVSQDGTEAVMCHRGDGWGLAELKNLGVPILVLSSEQNSVVRARCEKVGVECIQVQSPKLPVLQRWLDERRIDSSETVFVGNDVNDIECLQAVGCGVAVCDAHPKARMAARIVLSVNGGYGAVREVTDLILAHEKGA